MPGTAFPLSSRELLRQFPAVRIPVPLAIFLCISVVAAVWWRGTHNMDFLSPPPAEKLAMIRTQVEASMPRGDHPADAVSAPVQPEAPAPVKAPAPSIDPGDLSSPPALDEYRSQATKGAAAMVELASWLEGDGRFQRALLAWERVLDSTKPDQLQADQAITAIHRLRPTLPDWNMDPTLATPVVLHAGTGKKTAKLLKPILDETAGQLERASAGLLKISASVNSGSDSLAAPGPAPVALWFAGPTAESPSSEVLSFTVDSPESLETELQNTLFELIRSYLGRAIAIKPPPGLREDVPPLQALNSHISRLSWQNLGSHLNPPTPAAAAELDAE